MDAVTVDTKQVVNALVQKVKEYAADRTNDVARGAETPHRSYRSMGSASPSP
jgi:hypothetical protein